MSFNQMLNACEQGDLDTVLALLPHTDVQWFDSEPLRVAVKHNHTDIALALLPHSNPKVLGSTVLGLAFRHQNHTLIEAFMPVCDVYAADPYYAPFCDWVVHTNDLTQLDHTKAHQEHWDSALQLMAWMGPTHNMSFVLQHTSQQGVNEAYGKACETKNWEFLELLAHLKPPLAVKICHTMYNSPQRQQAKTLFQSISCFEDQASLRLLLEEAVCHMDHRLVDAIVPRIENKFHCRVIELIAERSPALIEHFYSLGFEVNTISAALIATHHRHLCGLLTSRNITFDVVTNLIKNNWMDEFRQAIESHKANNHHNFVMSFHFEKQNEERPEVLLLVERQDYKSVALLVDFLLGQKAHPMHAKWVSPLYLKVHNDPTWMSILEQHIHPSNHFTILKNVLSLIECDAFDRTPYVNVVATLCAKVNVDQVFWLVDIYESVLWSSEEQKATDVGQILMQDVFTRMDHNKFTIQDDVCSRMYEQERDQRLHAQLVEALPDKQSKDVRKI